MTYTRKISKNHIHESRLTLGTDSKYQTNNFFSTATQLLVTSSSPVYVLFIEHEPGFPCEHFLQKLKLLANAIKKRNKHELNYLILIELDYTDAYTNWTGISLRIFTAQEIINKFNRNHDHIQRGLFYEKHTLLVDTVNINPQFIDFFQKIDHKIKMDEIEKFKFDEIDNKCIVTKGLEYHDDNYQKKLKNLYRARTKARNVKCSKIISLEDKEQDLISQLKATCSVSDFVKNYKNKCKFSCKFSLSLFKCISIFSRSELGRKILHPNTHDDDLTWDYILQHMKKNNEEPNKFRESKRSLQALCEAKDINYVKLTKAIANLPNNAILDGLKI